MRGKVHKYLRVTIDYSLCGKVILLMIECIGKILDIVSTTPAAHHLFDVAEDVNNLSQANVYLFCHCVAQLLNLSKRARPEIHLEVSSQCTIVIGPETDDYKKMARVMKYIQGTISLPLIMSINKSGIIKWYFDASFAAHKDMGSHTGGFITMVTGGAYIQSIKQKLNTKS